VLYAALDPNAAFVETFGRDLGVRLVRLSVLAGYSLLELRPARPLRLANLSGAALRQVSADARVTTGDHRIARRWALALWSHPQQPDGLYWRSRFDDDRYCIALFDRAQDALTVTDLGTLDRPQHRSLLADILDAYGFGLM
jgi:hypothetical protein